MLGINGVVRRDFDLAFYGWAENYLMKCADQRLVTGVYYRKMLWMNISSRKDQISFVRPISTTATYYNDVPLKGREIRLNHAERCYVPSFGASLWTRSFVSSHQSNLYVRYQRHLISSFLCEPSFGGACISATYRDNEYSTIWLLYPFVAPTSSLSAPVSVTGTDKSNGYRTPFTTSLFWYTREPFGS